MKQLPNIFTLLNLFFGCIAVVTILQTGIDVSADGFGQTIAVIPEQIFMASLFITIAAIIDFLDGFVARFLNASSDLGKQLDSLADLVSFGVAPGMIVFQFLRLALAQHEDGLNTSFIWLMPAFIIPCAGAYRLARFNIDTKQSYGFKGLPIPATGLFIASLPLIYWKVPYAFVSDVFGNQWFWYALIITVSFLMVSTIPMLALKFKQLSTKVLIPFVIIVLVAIISALFLGWLSVPIAFFTYILMSFIFKPVKQ